MPPRKKKSAATDDTSRKHAVLDAALAHVPFDGFSDKTLARAGEEAGVDKETLAKFFPEGPLSLVAFFSERCDAEMETRLGEMKLVSLPIRERIAKAVLTRIDVLRPHKEAARRAAAFLSLPMHAGLGAKLVYRTVDAIWRAAGDKSTDFNFYTKRAILAGVYSATLMRWFTDTSAEESSTKEFLGQRIENVMQFEKFKAQVQQGMSRLPSLADILSGLSARKS
jgi:ubiquinone biosynthesis protein COQ9